MMVLLFCHCAAVGVVSVVLVLVGFADPLKSPKCSRKTCGLDSYSSS